MDTGTFINNAYSTHFFKSSGLNAKAKFHSSNSHTILLKCHLHPFLYSHQGFSLQPPGIFFTATRAAYITFTLFFTATRTTYITLTLFFTATRTSLSPFSLQPPGPPTSLSDLKKRISIWFLKTFPTLVSKKGTRIVHGGVDIALPITLTRCFRTMPCAMCVWGTAV